MNVIKTDKIYNSLIFTIFVPLNRIYTMKTIRIGTRDSALALWQAQTVQQQLEALGHTTELVPIKSEGDLNLTQPLYEMGITGIFTKALDIALLNKNIDIAVHSMKDVPTLLPEGLAVGAVLKRGNPFATHTTPLKTYVVMYKPD